MHAPTFNLFTTTGEIVRLEDYLGCNILITFWASWCPDCGKDLPKKEQLFQSIDKNNVKMLTINVAGRERDKADGIAYANKYLTQPTLLDNGREVYDAFQCKGVPTTVLINKRGIIVEKLDDQATMIEIVESMGKHLL